MDQIAASYLARDTQLASLELSLEAVELLGVCGTSYSCAYTNTVAWRTATTPLPMENNPRAVFERLFGASGSTGVPARMADIELDRSVLDQSAAAPHLTLMRQKRDSPPSTLRAQRAGDMGFHLGDEDLTADGV